MRHHALHRLRRTGFITRSAAALSGAGEAAFALGDYALALRYLSAAPGDVGADLRSTAAAVLGRDPLQPHLGAAVRRRRITGVLTDVVRAADSCLAGRVPPDDAGTAAVRQRRDEAARTPWLTSGPRRPARPADRDDLEEALVLAARLAGGLAEAGCPSTALQRALPLIAKRHELALQ